MTRRWIGGVFGNTISSTIASNNASGVFSMGQQYYIKQEGGWIPAALGTIDNPIVTGPSAFYTTGAALHGETYYWANVGSATQASPKQYEFVRHDNKSWVKITDTNFSSGTNGNQNSNFNFTSAGLDSSITGWQNLNGDWYWCSIPSTRDTEGWNNWDLGSISFRYWRCTMYWAPMSGGNSIPGGHPDNEDSDNFSTNDPEFDTRQTPGSGNKSFHRFGIGNVQHQAFDELGFSSQRTTVKTDIYTGDKSGNYVSGISRVGTGANGYWDLGSNSANRIFRTSSGDESGAGGDEQHAWCPHEMWLSDG